MATFKHPIQKALKPYAKVIPQLTKPALRVIIQVCVHYLENRKIPADLLAKAVKKSGIPESDDFYVLYGAIYQIFEVYLRTAKGHVKNDELRETLVELKFPDDCVDDMCKVLINHREPFSVQLYELKNIRDRPLSIAWRLNVSLLESQISRACQPTIVFYIEAEHGRAHSFQMSIAAFHKLRFCIARLLREMQSVEARQIMKK